MRIRFRCKHSLSKVSCNLLPSLAYASLRPSIHPLRHFIFLHSTKFRLPQNRVRIERGNQPRRRAIRPTMLYMLPSLSSPLLSLSIHPRFGRLMRAGCSDNISPPPPPPPPPPITSTKFGCCSKGGSGGGLGRDRRRRQHTVGQKDSNQIAAALEKR